MEIYFKDKSTSELIKGLKEQLGGRKLGDLLEFEALGDDIRVTIKKMGTSTLEFSHCTKNGDNCWELSKEKLALTHRAFKGEIMDKLSSVIGAMGGKVVN